MLDKEKIESLFELLERMTGHDKPRVNSRSDTLVMTFIFVLVAGMAATENLFFGRSIIFMIFLLSVILAPVFSIFLGLPELYRIVKFFHKRNLASIKIDLAKDKNFFDEICNFEMPIIEYVLAQYRHNFQNFDKKISAFLIIYGIFITTSIFALQLEAKSLGMPLLFFVGMSSAFFLSLVNKSKRPDQIIALLECAIRLMQHPKKA